MTDNKVSLGLKIGLGIAVALLIGTGIYTSSLYKSKVESENQLIEEKELVMKDLTAMASQYDLAISENEVANQNLEAANQNLIDAKSRIQALIDSLETSDANLKSLWRYKKKYLSLQKEMDRLLIENDQLKVQNVLLASSLDSTRVELAEKEVFTDSLMFQNVALSEVVEGAAVLTTTNLKGFAVIERGSGKQIPTERARRANKIKICFSVAKNKLVQPGDQELYIQIIDPKNNILGGNEQLQFGEETLNYSIISKFNYESKNLNICEFIGKNDKEDFEKGSYKVNIFNTNERIAGHEFTLR